MAKMPTMDEWAERLGNKAINEYVYEGRTLKEWIDLMASGKLVILPDNATNGDVIKALFPNADIDESQYQTPFIDVSMIGELKSFHADWWNEAYKEVENE